MSRYGCVNIYHTVSVRGFESLGHSTTIRLFADGNGQPVVGDILHRQSEQLSQSKTSRSG